MPIWFGYQSDLSVPPFASKEFFNFLFKDDVISSDFIRGGDSKGAHYLSSNPGLNTFSSANGHANKLGMKGVTNEGSDGFRCE